MGQCVYYILEHCYMLHSGPTGPVSSIFLPKHLHNWGKYAYCSIWRWTSRCNNFKSNYSTDTCIINLVDYIRREISSKNLFGLVMIDLQKAFYTVDHHILCGKLSRLGFKCIAQFRSYLSGRFQCVSVNGQD